MTRDEAACDIELVQRIRRGDESALSVLMNKYSARVFSTAFRVLRRMPDAQEVTQDVFFAIWRYPERFEITRGPLLTWLVILSRSRALDLLRRIQANTARHRELNAKMLDTSPALIQAFTPDRKLLMTELLQCLPIEQQRVLQALYIEGYRVRETAALLGAPLGTIKSRTRLALKKLRSAIAAYTN